MKAINKKQFSHKDMNAARKCGVISGLIWALDLLYAEQKKALNETRGPIKL